MKWKFSIIAAVVVITDTVAAVVPDQSAVRIFIILPVTVIGMMLQYMMVMRPVFRLKQELDQTREENAQLGAIRTDFVANVTHELKTPLTSISGFIETLQDGAVEDPKVRNHFLDIMAIETARLKRLINDILVLSDIENGEEGRKPERIDIRKEMDDIIASISPIAKSKNITVLTQIRSGLLIRGNADRFRQMIVNLVENAIKYSNEGSRVWIEGYLKDGRPVISVKDEGIGISEEHLDRLFERFYRVDKSRSRKEGGTGLGLSIVKHIVALFQARIDVESQLGKGTTFYIYF